MKRFLPDWLYEIIYYPEDYPMFGLFLTVVGAFMVAVAIFSLVLS